MRRNPALVLFAGSALLLGALVWAPALRDAFFLYDDFAHLDLCQRHGLTDFFREAMVGTFRPAGFLALWTEFRLFGWERPAGYLAVSALLYLANALLLWRVLSAFGETELVSGLAATYYLVFPATIELRVWCAGQWDLLCATGVLVSLLAWAGVWKHDAGLVRRSALAFGALSAFFVGLLAKEHAVGLLVLLPVLAMGRRDRERHGDRAAVVWALGASTLVVLVFLIARSRVLPPTSTHYGDVAALFRGAPLVGNLETYAKGLVTPPYPENPSFVSTLVGASGLLGLAGMLLGVRAAGALAGTGFLAAFVAFLGLVIWVPFVPGATTGGRYLHMPSLPAAILFGIGAAALLQSAPAAHRPARGVRLARASGAVLVGGFVLGALASGASAGRCWRDAARLSRSVLNQLEQRADAPALFVRNAPWGFRNGPPVTPCYAFPIYLRRRGGPSPLFRCDGVIVERGWRATLEWTPRRPDFNSQYAIPREDEVAVELDLQRGASSEAKIRE